MKPHRLDNGRYSLGAEKLARSISIRREDIDEEKRLVRVAFSSEAPVGRWWGVEILDHGPASVVATRFDTGAAVCVEHDRHDQVGVVESFSIDADRVGRAILRFGRSQRAEEIFRDVLDGIRSNVSVSYWIHEMVLEKEEKGAPSVYRVTRWEPLEISIVAVPADVTVGVGRSEGKEAKMPEETALQVPAAPAAPPGPSDADRSKWREDARSAELERIRNIEAIGKQMANLLPNAEAMARAAIEKGEPLEVFRGSIIQALGTSRPVPKIELGMDQREKQRYSFMRAINYLASPTDRSARDAAAFEIECSDQWQKRTKQNPGKGNSLLVPSDVQTVGYAQPREQRDMTAGTLSTGGVFVGTQVMSFLEKLVNSTVVTQRATLLRDLSGNIAIPRGTGIPTVYWVGEGSAGTESTPAFDQVTMTPKQATAYVDYSRMLLTQASTDIEALVRNLGATAMGLEVDRAAIHGAGTAYQPLGLLDTSGIAVLTPATNGEEPAWAHFVNLETEVNQDNALVGDVAYITNAKVVGKAKQTLRTATYGDTMLMTGAVNRDLEANGYPVYVTNQVSSTLTQGSSNVCSALIFGNWKSLIVGAWGGLEIQVDPYTAATSGNVRVVFFQSVDVGVMYPESFSVKKDVLTT